MKFVAHNHQARNSYAVDNFGPNAAGYAIANVLPVYITSSGIAFFMMREEWGNNHGHYTDKIAFIGTLHERLKEQFGHGLAAVTCAVPVVNPCPYFEGLFTATKAIDSSIRTIEIGHRLDYSSKSADVLIGDTEKPLYTRRLQAAVDVQIEDMNQPREGWAAYQEQLELIRDAAGLKAAETLGRPMIGFLPSRATTRKQFGGMRLDA